MKTWESYVHDGKQINHNLVIKLEIIKSENTLQQKKFKL